MPIFKTLFTSGYRFRLHRKELPGTRPEFWRDKLGRNVARDAAAVSALRLQGWRVLVVWECFTRQQQDLPAIAAAMSGWMAHGAKAGELAAPAVTGVVPVIGQPPSAG